MKKINKNSEPPSLLASYKSKNPAGTWVRFRKERPRRQQLKTQILTDQGGLCAYCEIDLKEADAHGNADYRVEHFHPKSDRASTSGVAFNWDIHWDNLFGCCHGGSRQDVVDAGMRFSNHDHSCDVPKAGKVLDGIILNPLFVPAFPSLFTIERSTGNISVNYSNCKTANVSAIQTRQTIAELRLNSPRLARLRKAVLDELNRDIRLLSERGMSIGDAKDRLSKVHLRKNSQQHWPAFFSSFRSYLGTEAERHLRSINYDG